MTYYITQAGALFLEAASKKLIIPRGNTKGKWLTPHEERLSKKRFGHGVPSEPTPNKKLIDGEWVDQPRRK